MTSKVWVDLIDRDCRYAADFKDFLTFDFGGRTLGNMPSYDIDQILSTGIVTQMNDSAAIMHSMAVGDR